MKKNLVLFDVDSTLIRVGNAAKKAMDAAYKEFLGHKKASINQIRYDGKTDKQIIMEVLALYDMARKKIESMLDEIAEYYLASLEENLKIETNFTIFPGVTVLLENLQNDDEIVLGLLTGNLERGARLKLSPFGFNKYFAFGAFGSDSIHRNKLVPFAVKRAEKLFGKKFSGKEIVIIGDSIHDINCGKPYGAKTIAVATGFTSIKELKQHNPDYVFSDLSDTKSVINAIKS